MTKKAPSQSLFNRLPPSELHWCDLWVNKLALQVGKADQSDNSPKMQNTKCSLMTIVLKCNLSCQTNISPHHSFKDRNRNREGKQLANPEYNLCCQTDICLFNTTSLRQRSRSWTIFFFVFQNLFEAAQSIHHCLQRAFPHTALLQR